MRSLSKTLSWLCISVAYMTIFISCQKEVQPKQEQQSEETATAANNSGRGHLKQTKEYSSDVLFRWIDFQLLNLYKINAGAMGGIGGGRFAAWTGITAYESVVPGMPAYQSLSGQLTTFTGLPKTDPGFAYHWPESLNAALAYITMARTPTNALLFPAPAGAEAAQLLGIKNFSDDLYNEFRSEGARVEVLDRSKAFGEAVAAKIVEWINSENKPVIVDTYPTESGFNIATGDWVRTNPNAPSALRNWGLSRLFAPGSLQGIVTSHPYTYSTAQGSDFRSMVQAIYDKSYNPHNLNLSDRLTIANYYAIPGYGAGHYLNIVKQVLEKANPTLDISALILAQAGMAVEDAGVGCVQVKYANNVVRPQTYIRKIFGDAGWIPSIGQPNHPEYPSGHSTLAGATAEILTYHFGDNFSFTDKSFVDFTGNQHFVARAHSSFTEMANEIGDSRVYGQIHYPKSCEDGQALGRKVAQNILSTVKFLKE
jgi:PAP2 superfamily